MAVPTRREDDSSGADGDPPFAFAPGDLDRAIAQIQPLHERLLRHGPPDLHGDLAEFQQSRR
ncbi:MAG: hypothetical protein KA020_04780, partial [Planctomycetes bacterium]|nr:hypothetical protein [Planctomycetota bacterium]